MKTIEALIMRTLPQDKCLHMLAGVLVFSLAHVLSWQLGLVTVVVLAITKEILDHFTGGDVSVWDVLATVTGGLLGAACFVW